MRKDRSETKQKLMEAALEVFTEKGFAGASTREIVEKSGVTKPTLYYYFGSKENLYRTLIEEDVNFFNQGLKEIADSEGDPVAKLLRVVEQRIEYSRRSPRRVQLVMRTLYHSDPLSPEIDLKKHGRPGLEATARIVREGIEKKIFRKADPAKLALQLLGLLHVQTVLILMGKNPYPLSSPKEIIETFTRGIRRK